MSKTLLFICVLAVFLQSVGMPGLKCTGCDKYCFQKKGRSQVGRTEYLRVFLKAEKGLTEEELNDKSTIICNACRVYISVFVQLHFTTDVE